MSKINDWAIILFWAGMAFVILGAIIHDMITYEITLEKILAPIHQVEWTWGARITVVGLAILMVSLVLIIIALRKERKEQ